MEITACWLKRIVKYSRMKQHTQRSSLFLTWVEPCPSLNGERHDVFLTVRLGKAHWCRTSPVLPDSVPYNRTVDVRLPSTESPVYNCPYIRSKPLPTTQYPLTNLPPVPNPHNACPNLPLRPLYHRRTRRCGPCLSPQLPHSP